MTATHTASETASRTSDYDVVVIGSGFGGSVAALRAAEKGYSVLVLEAGRRFEDEDFAETSWDVRRFLWAPPLCVFAAWNNEQRAGANQQRCLWGVEDQIAPCLKRHHTSRVMKNPGCRLLKKISEPRRAKNRRAEAYLARTW